MFCKLFGGRCRFALAALLLCVAQTVCAGNVFFGMARVDNRMLLTNLGNTSAFHPQVLRLLADGSWQPLLAAPGHATTVELVPHRPLELQWPGSPPGQADPQVGQFGALLPMMVRFYDQAGADFGQISFFAQPPMSSEPLVTAYRDGQLEISPPTNAKIRASWLLWAQEEGIAPLTGAVRFSHTQPAARRIVWRSGMAAERVFTGAGQPSAMLLHETASGFELQSVNRGNLQGQEQRHSWLNASAQFYWLAALALAVAGLAALLAIWNVWRKKRSV